MRPQYRLAAADANDVMTSCNHDGQYSRLFFRLIYESIYKIKEHTRRGSLQRPLVQLEDSVIFPKPGQEMLTQDP